jgi:hypothetical protein
MRNLHMTNASSKTQNIENNVCLDERLYRIDGPHWKNLCNHSASDYLMTIKIPNYYKETLDIYIFENKESCLGQQVCMRYGNEDSEYYSMGNIINIIEILDLKYEVLLNILKSRGQFKWVPYQS